jgi:hypothetical protein
MQLRRTRQDEWPAAGIIAARHPRSDCGLQNCRMRERVGIGVQQSKVSCKLTFETLPLLSSGFLPIETRFGSPCRSIVQQRVIMEPMSNLKKKKLPRRRNRIQAMPCPADQRPRCWARSGAGGVDRRLRWGGNGPGSGCSSPAKNRELQVIRALDFPMTSIQVDRHGLLVAS